VICCHNLAVRDLDASLENTQRTSPAPGPL
jgi:hypothetical protein